MQPLIELKEISKTYHSLNEETVAIEGFSLKVFKNDFIAIVGPSGCGKSTVLSIISGLSQKSGGELCFGKEDISIGYMLQHDHLFPWRTIFKNAVIGLEIQKKLTKDNIDYVNKLLDTYGLSEFKNSYPSQLSGGMRQRVALIRTLALKPDVLLLDEPFSALDYQTRLAVSEDISSIIKKEDKTAVFVTHDLTEAISLSNRVVVMSQRPSVVKSVYDIEFDNNITAQERRKLPQFASYYEMIWKDLDVHV